MKRGKSIPNRLSKIVNKNRANIQGHKALVILLIFVLLILSIGMIQGTLGKFAHSFIKTESATAAKFDIVITTPEEFVTENGITSFENYFHSNYDVKILEIHVYNDGETDVLCTPYITDGIFYRIFIDMEERTEFVLKPKESETFYIGIGAFGLDTNITEAGFYIDVQQIEGGPEYDEEEE